jgi:hypothetical protein
VTTSSNKEVPPNVAVHRTKKGVEGGKKRCKWRTQVTTTDCDNANDGEVGGSDVRCISTAAHGDKRQVSLPMDHFKRFLEEACPNHAYPIKHKLKECGMMRIFMTSESLTWVWSLMKTRARMIRCLSLGKMQSWLSMEDASHWGDVACLT